MSLILLEESWAASWGKQGSDGHLDIIDPKAGDDVSLQCLYALGEALTHYRATHDDLDPAVARFLPKSRREGILMIPFIAAMEGNPPQEWNAEAKRIAELLRESDMKVEIGSVALPDMVATLRRIKPGVHAALMTAGLGIGALGRLVP